MFRYSEGAREDQAPEGVFGLNDETLKSDPSLALIARDNLTRSHPFGLTSIDGRSQNRLQHDPL
jgi:hypothetical protein